MTYGPVSIANFATTDVVAPGAPTFIGNGRENPIGLSVGMNRPTHYYKLRSTCHPND
jgi:hypothetical protein